MSQIVNQTKIAVSFGYATNGRNINVTIMQLAWCNRGLARNNRFQWQPLPTPCWVAENMAGNGDKNLSTYAIGLSSVARARYSDKLQLCGLTIDPYISDLSLRSKHIESWPSIDYPDIYMYFLDSISPYTKDTLRNYKSMDSYAYFVAGFVSEIFCVKSSKDIRILTAKVPKLAYAALLVMWVER